MKTIQRLNRGLIGLSHEITKTLFIITIVFSLMFLVSCVNTSYDARKYKDEDSVITVFQNSRKDFEEFSKLLCNNELFYDIFDNTGDNDVFSPYSFQWNKYFSKEQFSKIENFFQKYKPYSVSGMSGYVKISFLTQRDSIELLDLSHLDAETLEYKLTYYSQDYDVISLNNNWYYII